MIQIAKWPVIIFILLIGGSLALQLRGAWEDSLTRDEPSHIVDGLAYWQLGSFEFNYPHPPLAKLLPGLVAYRQGARIDATSPGWMTQDTEAVNVQVLFDGRTGDEIQRFVFWARIPMLVFPIGLLILMWAWGRRKFGDIPALVAVTLVGFDPSLIGHGPLVNTDVPAMAMIFATVVVTDVYLRRSSRRNLGLLGLVLSLTLITKFSAIFLIPIIAVIVIFKRWHSRQPKFWTHIAKELAVIAGIVLAAMILFYQGDGILQHRGPFPAWSVTVGTQQITPPITSYWRGLAYNIRHNAEGHRTVFRGQVLTAGTWTYFPVALATKLPMATIALWFLGVGFGLRSMFRRPRLTFMAIIFILPALVYALSASISNLNLGIRHVFPLFPFMATLVAWAVKRLNIFRWGRWVTLATALSLIPVAILAYPNTIAYFNGLAGGSIQGPRWFIDSNTDWGQDAWRVRDYLRQQPSKDISSESPLHLTLFGTTPPRVITAGSKPVPNDNQIKNLTTPLGRVIISDAFLHAPDRPYIWPLTISRDLRPERIGSTVTVFHFETTVN